MKKFLSYSLLAAAAAAGVSLADTATTPPVGYVTIPIAGNAASNPFGADTYISPVLPQPAVLTAATSVAPVSGSKTATFSGSVPTNLDNSYVLEIGDGTKEGWWSVVQSSTATTITTVSAFPAGLATATKITVRKLDTLQSFLGENTIALGPNDQVQILNPITQSAKVALYVSGAGYTGGGEWQDAVLEANIDNEYIYPGTAVKVRIFGATGKTLVTAGNVKVSKTDLDLYPGTNWLSGTAAVGGTVGSMTFGTQLIAEDYNPATTPADVIEFIAPNQSASSYARVGNSVQNLVTETDASTLPVNAGTGYAIFRNQAAAAGIVTVPGQTVGN